MFIQRSQPEASWSGQSRPRSVNPPSPALFVTTVFLLSVWAGVAHADDAVFRWIQGVGEATLTLRERGHESALVRFRVAEVDPGILWQGERMRRSAVGVQDLEVLAGSIPSPARFFVRVSVRIDDPRGPVYSGGLAGEHAQLWLTPGEEIVAMVWRPSASARATGQGDLPWWNSEPWMEVAFAAQIEPEGVRIVTRVEPRKGIATRVPNSAAALIGEGLERTALTTPRSVEETLAHLTSFWSGLGGER